MLRSSVRATLAAVFLIATAVGADDPWRYVDPAAKFVAGVQWRAIRESPVGLRLRQSLDEMLPMPSLPGTKIMSGVESVIISSTGLTNGSPAGGQPSFLLAASGKFDLAEIRKSVKHGSKRAIVQSAEIYQSAEKGSSRVAIALVSPGLLLFGETSTLVRALANSSFTTRTEGDAIAKGRKLSATNELWAILSMPPADFTGQEFPIPLPMEDVRGLALGVAVREGLSIDVSLDMQSNTSAETLKTELVRMIKLAAKEKGRPDLAGFDKLFHITAENGEVHLTAKLEAADLEKRVKAYQARAKAEQQVLAAAVVPTPEIKPVAPPPPVDFKPKIFNLDPPDQP
jgi:hypothetical protein